MAIFPDTARSTLFVSQSLQATASSCKTSSRYSANLFLSYFSKIAKVDKASYLDKGLKDGVAYRYKIQAEDKDGLVSDYSEFIAVNTKSRPKSTEGLSGRYEAGKAEISWNANKETDIAQYIVYEKRFFSLEKLAEVKSTSYTDSSIVKGKSKIYVVTAVDRDGLESEPSAELSVSAK